MNTPIWKTKELHINRAIPLIEVHGSANIPTVVFYSNDKCYIGTEAKSLAGENKQLDDLREDFKIELGNKKANIKSNNYNALDVKFKSADELTSDFLFELLNKIDKWLSERNIHDVNSIVVAEPISIQGKEVDHTWLATYRNSIRKTLKSKGFTDKNIDFMPEPFAVFQYYKYGERPALLGEKTKQHVLVIDFGGGSLDICVIETDNEGEITGKRKNSKPYGAKSEAIGGFFINRKIAEKLLVKYNDSKKNFKIDLKKGLDIFKSWRRGEDLTKFASKYMNFVYNFQNLCFEIEDSKIALCKSITNWSMEANLNNLSIPIKLLKNPFSESLEYFIGELTASELREIFRELWNERIKLLIRDTLKRSSESLEGASISLVLLSGGSCNIRWIETLLQNDFQTELSEAQMIPLDDFQEVVAKGLAIECVRKFYSESNTGDFASVIYNGLNLVLDPDGFGLEINRKYSPQMNDPINSTTRPCVLIPSASILQKQLDKPLVWRIRLSRPPKKFLDFFFLRSGLTPYTDEDESSSLDLDHKIRKYSDNLLNLENNRVHTPKNVQFDSNGFLLELTIGKENKTAIPKFYYKDCIVEGKPFYIDITDAQDNNSKSYIGLDFGTSNTSISYLNQDSIRLLEKRSKDKKWLSITELPSALPYPLACPLARYVSEYDKSKRISLAREFIESSLSLAAYISYIEMSLHDKPQTSFLKEFKFQSIGPLWKLFQNSILQLNDNAIFSFSLKKLVGDYFNEINIAVAYFNDQKHEKVGESEFNENIVSIIANIFREFFRVYKFGYFDNIKQNRFVRGEYTSLFREAYGNNTNFVNTHELKGSSFPPSRGAVLVDLDNRKFIELYPFIFWYECKKHPDEEHCFIYDKSNKVKNDNKSNQEHSFKAAGFTCSCTLDNSHPDLAPISYTLAEYLKVDPSLTMGEY